MGQYYRPLLFRADENNCNNSTLLASFYSWDYNSGLKLMEHSWVHNRLVCAVLCKIREYGKVRVVWAGDYADDELQRLLRPSSTNRRIGEYRTATTTMK